ncbi:phasin family protein [Clostridium perfringens]|uniref:phasin family protein n=1 Tax=Clostridium perfringens TaxID=1502 RepID=UPI000F52FF2D|nr:hypothetical protein [Clostridium perfringens]
MINELKKAILAGIGTAATAYEKTDSFIQDMVTKGKITVEDGKVLSEELKRDIEEKTTQATSEIITKLDNMKPFTKEDFKAMFDESNKSTLEEINKLKERIAVLEAKLNEEEI